MSQEQPTQMYQTSGYGAPDSDIIRHMTNDQQWHDIDSDTGDRWADTDTMAVRLSFLSKEAAATLDLYMQIRHDMLGFMKSPEELKYEDIMRNDQGLVKSIGVIQAAVEGKFARNLMTRVSVNETTATHEKKGLVRRILHI